MSLAQQLLCRHEEIEDIATFRKCRCMKCNKEFYRKVDEQKRVVR